MLKNYCKAIVTILCIAISSISINAQVIIVQRTPIIPIGSLPTFYNGGFAGEGGASRIANSSYVGKMGDNGPIYFGTIVSYDNFIKKMSSGISMSSGLSKSHIGPNELTSSFVGIGLSPKISFNGKYTFAPSADLNFGKVDGSLSDGSSTSGRIGFLFNRSNAYIGTSVRFLLNRINHISLLPTLNRQILYSLQGGYSFQRTPDSKFSFTPQLVVEYYQLEYFGISPNATVSYNLLRRRAVISYNLNLIFRYNKFIWGFTNAGFNLTANELVVGFQNSKLKIQFSSSFLRGFYHSSLDHYHYYDRGQIINSNISVRYQFDRKGNREVR
jgi:hypothetical protein